MPSSVFVTTLNNGIPVLPEITEDDLVDGKYPEGTGFTTIGPSPQDTIIVRVTRRQAVIDQMKADPKYLWVEDIADA